MTNELLIAIEFARSDWGKQALNMFKAMPGIKTVQWTENMAETGAGTAVQVPDIIIVDDTPECGPLFSRIQNIRRNFPQTSLFVVSSNQDPQQIIKTMKAGVAEYLVEPVDEAILQNAVEEVRVKLTSAGRLAQGSIYSFISAKGGIGATVLAANTAAALAMGKKHAVALLDMSFQAGDASVLLDVEPKATILDICRNFNRLDFAFLRAIMTGHTTGLNFLAAPPNPEESSEISAEHIGQTLELTRKTYDHVFIDCSSMHITPCSVEAFKRSDKVFILTDMSLPSIRNAVRLSKLIQKMATDRDKIEFIINRYIKSAPLSLNTIEKNFNKPAYWLVPNDFADVVTSINQGVPLVKLKPGSIFSKNIEQMGKKILHQLDDAEFRGIRGKFGRNL